MPATDDAPLFDRWRVFRETVIPQLDHPKAIEMIRIAFYAGASAMIGLVETRINDDAIPIDDLGARLEALDAEAAAFISDLRL